MALACEDALTRLSSFYAALWEEIRQTRNTPAVLLRIASGLPPYGGPLTRSQVALALRRLEQLTVLHHSGRGRYRLVEPMFGTWIQRQQAAS